MQRVLDDLKREQHSAVGIKRLVKRMPAILLGYFCACLTAGPVLIAADLWWMIGPGLRPELLLLPLYIFVIYAGVLLPPVLIVACICEFLCVQRLAAYLVLGALSLLFPASVLLGPVSILGSVTTTAVITFAGLAAGLVYWLVAGRKSGLANEHRRDIRHEGIEI